MYSCFHESPHRLRNTLPQIFSPDTRLRWHPKGGDRGGVLERGAIFEIGLERGAQKNEIVSERGALMPNKEKRLERGAKLWVGALSDN